MRLTLTNSAGCELASFELRDGDDTGHADLPESIHQDDELSSTLSYLQPGDTITITA